MWYNLPKLTKRMELSFQKIQKETSHYIPIGHKISLYLNKRNKYSV